MKTKGFTFIELLVTIVIIAALSGLVVGTYNQQSSGEWYEYISIDPRRDAAVSQRRIADEMTRQNDMMQRRLELLEQQNQKAEHE